MQGKYERKKKVINMTKTELLSPKNTMNNPIQLTGDQRWLRPHYSNITEYIRDRLSSLAENYDSDSDWIRGQVDFYNLALNRAQQMNIGSFLAAQLAAMSDRTDSFALGRRQACEALTRAMNWI